eukprot:scaffold5060_cov123-Isochrysis_galbana.AAC.8
MQAADRRPVSGVVLAPTACATAHSATARLCDRDSHACLEPGVVDVLPVRLPPCTKPTCHHRRSCRLSLSSPHAGAARRHPYHTTTTAGAPSPPLLWPAVQLSSASVSISPRGEAPLLPCAALAGTATRHAALTAWQPLCHCVAYAPQYSSPARGHHRTTATAPT